MGWGQVGEAKGEEGAGLRAAKLILFLQRLQQDLHSLLPPPKPQPTSASRVPGASQRARNKRPPLQMLTSPVKPSGCHGVSVNQASVNSAAAGVPVAQLSDLLEEDRKDTVT